MTIIKHANFTGENCTGTGDALTFNGAITSDDLLFAASFAVGDRFYYSGIDAAGTKISGLGVKQSTTFDRNDSWNAVAGTPDEDPSTNVTLVSPTKIRCTPVAEINPIPSILRSGTDSSAKYMKPQGDRGAEATDNTAFPITDINHRMITVPAGADVSSVTFNVTTGAGSALARVGIASLDEDGNVLSLLGESASIDCSTTGIKTGTFTAVHFPTQMQIVMWLSTDTSISVSSFNRSHYTATEFESVDVGTLRSSAGLVMPVASGQPVYPTPAAFNALPSGGYPELVLGWD